MKKAKWLIYGFFIPLLMLSDITLADEESGDLERFVLVSGYQASLVFADILKAGENSVHIQILDKKGLPISDAQVAISAMPVKGKYHGVHTMTAMPGMNHDMAAMSGMSGMDAAPTLATPNKQPLMAGDYIGVINFPTEGHWLLNAHISTSGQIFNAAFPVEVAHSSTSTTILLAFGGLNVIIILLASMTRRKPVATEPNGDLI